MVLVVAANSRGRCSALVSLPNSESVPLGPRAAVVRVAHKVQKGRRSTAPWSMLTKTRREVNADGADGRVKWNGSKQFRRRAAWPLVRSPVAASDGRGSSSIGARSGSQSHLAVVSVGTQVASRCAAVTTGVLASTCPPLRLQAGRALDPEIGTRDPLAQSLLP